MARILGVATSGADIDSGLIDGAAIGSKMPSTGAFTTLSANGVTSLGATTLPTAVFTGSAPTVLAAQVGYGGTTSATVGAAGAATALPANPTGYLLINVAGTVQRIPYFN